MKTRNRVFTLLLVLTLAAPLLPAAALGTAAPQGMYIENLMTLPDGFASITAITVKPDGAVVAAAKQRDTGAWALLTWTDINTAPEVTPLNQTGGDITQIDYAPDGSLLVISNDMKLMPEPPLGQNGPQVQGSGPMVQEGVQKQGVAGGNAVIGSIEDMSSTAAWYNIDGTLTSSFQIKGYVAQAAALNSRQVAVLGMQSGITVYDEKGNSASQIAASGIIGIAASGETLIALSNDKLTQYDAKSCQKLGTTDLKADFSARVAIVPDGTAYIMDNTGLYAVKPEGASQTMLMNAIGTLTGDPNNGISDIAVMKDGTIVALLTEGGGSLGGGKSVRIGGIESNMLAAYRYTDAANASARQDFTITSLYSSSKLRKAASDFQRLHPELNVKLQTQLAEGDDSPVEDRIRTLNTDLLAGKGGDVLILDGLPIAKYAQRGILMDLSSLLKDIVFLPGIREGSTASDGKLYAMPAQFAFELLWGKADTASAIKTLEDLPTLPLASGQSLLHPRTYEDWLRMFYPASEPQFLNESGQLQFDSPAFEAFLETLYKLYVQQGDLPSEDLSAAKIAKGGIVPAEVVAILNGATALFPTTVNSLMQLNLAYTVSGGEESGFVTVPSLHGAGYGYTPSLMAGINAQSPNQTLAEEFLLTLYSPEIQALDQMDGLPTVAASLNKQFEDALERNQGGKKMVAMFAVPGTNPIEMKQPDEATWQNLRALCDTLTVPVCVDETLLGFIVDETEAFFAGSVTAGEAALAVQQRAWAYLNE